MNVIEINSKTEYELILRRRGRLILKSNSKESVVFGCGSSKKTMLADLNRCSVSKQNKLNFVEA